LDVYLLLCYWIDFDLFYVKKYNIFSKYFICISFNTQFTLYCYFCRCGTTRQEYIIYALKTKYLNKIKAETQPLLFKNVIPCLWFVILLLLETIVCIAFLYGLILLLIIILCSLKEYRYLRLSIDEKRIYYT